MINTRNTYYVALSEARRLIRNGSSFNDALDSVYPNCSARVQFGVSHALGAFSVPDPYIVPASKHISMLRRMGIKTLKPRYKSTSNASKRFPK